MRRMIKQAIVYRMAILIGVLFSFNALSAAIVASFMNAEWSTMSNTSRFLVIVVIIQNWTGTMLAFFNKTLARLEQNQPPFGYPGLLETKEQTKEPNEKTP